MSTWLFIMPSVREDKKLVICTILVFSALERLPLPFAFLQDEAHFHLTFLPGLIGTGVFVSLSELWTAQASKRHQLT